MAAPLCFQLLDGENRSYPIELFTGADVGWPDGEVAAGSSRRGLIVYEVPVDTDSLHLQFKCELFSRGIAGRGIAGRPGHGAPSGWPAGRRSGSNGGRRAQAAARRARSTTSST